MPAIDWSQTRANWSFVTVGTSAAMVLTASEKRVGLILTGPQAGRVTLGTTSAVALDQGVTLSASMGVLEIWYEYMGNAVTFPLWGIADQAGRNLGIIETLSG